MKWTEKKKNYQHFHQEKIDKYEYLTGENILPFDESRIINILVLHILCFEIYYKY